MRWVAWLTICGCALGANGLEIDRPARPWEFVDAPGPKAALLGAEDGTLEALVYPMKIFRDFRLIFVVDGRAIPAATISRRIEARPGAYTLVYTGDEFQARETLAASPSEAGAVIELDITAYQPLEIQAEFVPDYQLLWPAASGADYAEWSGKDHAFVFSGPGGYAALFGSPDAVLVERDYQSDYGSRAVERISLGKVTGRAKRTLAVAGSTKSADEARAIYLRLASEAAVTIGRSRDFYRDYLAGGVQVEVPDETLQSAYDWSRASMREAMVENPLLGRGLVAGYGPTKGSYRPGYAWFFGRDTFWTAFALNSAGDFETSRAAIEFIAGFQREDGKMPHEIAQTATLVDWFHALPYAYASADATPLFAIAVADYVRTSGDVEFARSQWPRLRKALAFMRSTLDEDGFPRNLGVGHGWVEGGRLLPVRTELYQAACYVEALRSLGDLAGLIGEEAAAKELEAEFAAKRVKLNERYWIEASGSYAFAIGTAGKPVDQPSVLATVPMWFDVLDQERARRMIEKLAGEDHASDWGMRIISSVSPQYSPEGYHYGSVWPLFTGWASTGEYREHAAEAGLANLRANAWLALDGAGGNVTEVLSGATDSALSTASPHQTWSAAMVVSPLVRGLLGLDVDAARHRVRLDPHLPAGWRRAAVRNVPLGGGRVDFAIERDEGALRLTVTNRGAGSFALAFAPAYAPCTRVTSAEWNGKSAEWQTEKHGVDWHPRLRVEVGPGGGVMVLRQQGTFGYAMPDTPPVLGEPSAAAKLISEQWSEDGAEVKLVVSGRHGRDYRIALFGSQRPRDAVTATIPGGDPQSYGVTTVDIRLKGAR